MIPQMPELTMKLVQQHQAEVRKAFQTQTVPEVAHRRFLQLFHLRRALHRWAPGLAARML